MDGSNANTSKPEYWRAQLGKQQISGLTQREYCRREGVSYSRFQYWKDRVRSAEGESNTLVRVPVKLTERGAPTVEVLVGRRFVVRVGAEVSEQHMVRVIRSLESLR